MTDYVAGTLVRTRAVYRRNPSDGSNPSTWPIADPTTVQVRYRLSPSGSVVTKTYPADPIVKETTGIYHYDIDTTGSVAVGRVQQTAEWNGSGNVQAIGDDSWYCNAPAV